MYDPTPPPYGEITRRWTLLDRDTRHRQAVRLLGSACGTGAIAHVDRPGLDAGACYHQLVPAAASGDPVALGWVAATHRPLLVTRGRALFEHDPTEWGSVCLEALHRTFASADLSETRWLRRRVSRALANRLSLVVGQHLDRRRRECPVADASLHARQATDPSWDWDPHPELSLDLDRVLDTLDEPTRDSLLALANRVPLAEVAERHGLSYDAVRQRVCRARKRLRPELAAYVRTGQA
jgi:DNA-directed RNA polymerase specialized sigma24 family protein